MKKAFLLSVFLLALTACSKKNHKNKHRVDRLHCMQESIARLSQVPDAPVFATIKRVVRSEINPDDIQAFYTVGRAISTKELKQFYMEEMERLGWNLRVECEAEELLLEFIRPNHQICIISFRKQHELVITLCTKKDMQ